MLHSNPSHLYNLPIYKKAKEIRLLSHRISSYLNYDLSALKDDGSENQDIYLTGDIVQQSESLAPEILKAELNSEKKHVHAKTVEWITMRMNNTCKRLEKFSSDGRDFIPILRSELKKFRKLQRSWMLNL
ncbi:MAG: hypothetical protein HKN54_12580 [Flavobacteriaceae bacterium]|nr:hypothetical protein [Flavobacteriaceae bacterium]